MSNKQIEPKIGDEWKVKIPGKRTKVKRIGDIYLKWSSLTQNRTRYVAWERANKGRYSGIRLADLLKHGTLISTKAQRKAKSDARWQVISHNMNKRANSEAGQSRVNQLVRIIRNDDGDKQDTGHLWHLVDPANESGPAALCTQEFFGPGESDCEYEEKTVSKGGITCPRCLEKVKAYKAVQL